MKIDKFKSIVKEAVKGSAFLYLLQKKSDRKSENAKGKHLVYHEFQIAEYLCPSEADIPIEERKWLFKCRVDDINIKGNQRWKQRDITCSSCQRNSEETHFHLLNCEALLGKNELLTYIPDYNELYKGDILEQVYVSRVLKENFRNRVSEQELYA